MADKNPIKPDEAVQKNKHASKLPPTPKPPTTIMEEICNLGPVDTVGEIQYRYYNDGPVDSVGEQEVRYRNPGPKDTLNELRAQQKLKNSEEKNEEEETPDPPRPKI
jgi:hypothetical protein